MRCAPFWTVLLALLPAATAAHAQQPIGELYASEASVRGAVALSAGGASVLSGSQVTAGEATALLRLRRSGELRICPRTTLSLTTDAAGKSLVLGMNAGALELDYALTSSADSLLTPDFRLQLVSPGDFHFAISVAPSGDTCLRSLPGNSASVFVAEMMGTGSYQLAPGRAVLFKAGRISGATEAPPACGCPALPPAPLYAAAPPAPAAAASTTPQPAPAAVPAESHNAAHLEVDTQFTFRAQDHQRDLAQTVARLRSEHKPSPLALALLPQITPPRAAAAPPPAHSTGFFGRMRAALKRVFAP